MKFTPILVAALFSGAALISTSNPAAAFCGGVEKSATAKSTKKASRKAIDQVKWELRKLRKQYGKKFVADNPSVACVGGAVAIDDQGNQIVGRPSCTATAGFCVNP
jgi:hypothetical protein